MPDFLRQFSLLYRYNDALFFPYLKHNSQSIIIKSRTPWRSYRVSFYVNCKKIRNGRVNHTNLLFPKEGRAKKNLFIWPILKHVQGNTTQIFFFFFIWECPELLVQVSCTRKLYSNWIWTSDARITSPPLYRFDYSLGYNKSKSLRKPERTKFKVTGGLWLEHKLSYSRSKYLPQKFQR